MEGVQESRIRRGEVSSPTETLKKGDGTSPLRKAALGRMVAYFKYEATKRINVLNRTPGKKLFQRNYYDHIIRDDIAWFFIEQYISGGKAQPVAPTRMFGDQKSQPPLSF